MLLEIISSEMIMSSQERYKKSGLFYHGTQQEVRLGDNVKLKRWFRKDQQGVVCYIPGISAKHKELEYGDVKQWAIKTKDGTVYPILYDPIGFQPPKHIILLSRGQEESLDPDFVLAEGTITGDD
jgi:hypothetical protein